MWANISHSGIFEIKFKLEIGLKLEVECLSREGFHGEKQPMRA